MVRIRYFVDGMFGKSSGDRNWRGQLSVLVIGKATWQVAECARDSHHIGHKSP